MSNRNVAAVSNTVPRIVNAVGVFCGKMLYVLMAVREEPSYARPAAPRDASFPGSVGKGGGASTTTRVMALLSAAVADNLAVAVLANVADNGSGSGVGHATVAGVSPSVRLAVRGVPSYGRAGWADWDSQQLLGVRSCRPAGTVVLKRLRWAWSSSVAATTASSIVFGTLCLTPKANCGSEI